MTELQPFGPDDRCDDSDAAYYNPLHGDGHVNVSDSRACATLFGVGTPRTLQGRVTALGAALSTLWTFIDDALIALPEPSRDPTRSGASVAGFVLTDSSV